jgi:spore germination protein YaaH
VLSYVAAVKADKLILGTPLYGVSWPLGHRLRAPPGTPIAVTYGQVLTAGHQGYWDPSTETPFERFRSGSRDYETWYDDPVSLALKTALAVELRLAGVGVWALGMDGNDAVVRTALAGGAPVVKLPLTATG